MNNKRTKTQIENRVRLNSRGVKSTLHLNNNSGRIIYRYFQNALTDPKQSAIILGTDVWGDEWVLHNNSETGIALIEPKSYFTKGDNWFNDERPLFYDRYKIVDDAITFWKERLAFTWLNANRIRFEKRILLDASPEISHAIERGGILNLVGLAAGKKEIITNAFSATGSLARNVAKNLN